MIVEWELVLYCNYNCSYCGLLDPSIKPIVNRDVLEKFIKSLKQYNTEIFCFGGEPYLHPQIEFIIRTLKKYDVPFVIQTNMSEFSVNKIREIDVDYPIQVSVHLEYTTINECIERLNTIKHKVRKVDIMYSHRKALDYFTALHKAFPSLDIKLAPVSNFRVTGFEKVLEEYNLLKMNPVYRKVFAFDDCMKVDPKSGELLPRSVIWERMLKGETTTKGRPCRYKGKYILFDPSLRRYNCSYRKNTTICEEDYCFLM